MFDLERRAPVWEALATLFVDADLGEQKLCEIAHVLKESRYSDGELQEIYEREVAPVCYNNLFHLTAAHRQGGPQYDGGQTTARPGVNVQWLHDAILDHVERRSAALGWWPFASVPGKMGVQMTRSEWQGVMRMLRRLHRDPQRLAQTLQRSPDVATLQRALDDLALLGREGEPAGPAICDALSHRDFRVRAAAVAAAAGVLGRGALGPVIVRLDDDSPTVRAAAIAALHRVVEGIVDPLPAGADGSVVPTESDHLLGRIAEQALDSICNHLEEGKSADRLHAARVLGLLGPVALGAVQTLFDSFGDRNEAVRRAVADAVVAVGPQPEQTRGRLTRALFDDSSRVRQTAALCLGTLLANGDRRYKPAMKALEVALGDSTPTVCQEAASTIGWIGKSAAQAVPDLAGLARSPEASTRAAALFALGHMEEAALEELPTMVGALEDDHPEVRRSALRAFQKLGPLVAQLEPQFEEMLDDPDWLTQFEAKRTLEAIRDEDPRTRSGRFGARAN